MTIKEIRVNQSKSQMPQGIGSQIVTPEHLHRKQHGIYYTSGPIVDLLCNWSIRDSSERILEPSFGGCGFIRACHQRLADLGCSQPMEQLHGCDIDPAAFKCLSSIFGTENYESHYKKGDFLGITATDLVCDGVNVVIGNPPYVSHHNMIDDQKKVAFELGDTYGFKQRKASLWAYFILHSMSFLVEGGRMAWILPGSAIYSEYGSDIRTVLRMHFQRSVCILLGERIFLSAGTEEQSVIVLCENFQSRPSKSVNEQQIYYASTVSEMAGFIGDWSSGKRAGVDAGDRIGFGMLDEAVGVFRNLSECRDAAMLGDYCKFRIGIVTGDTKFFVLSQGDVAIHRIPEAALTFVVPALRSVPGLEIVPGDTERIVKLGQRCLLVDTLQFGSVTGNVKAYLDTYDESKRISNSTFRKRARGELWHRPNDGQVPHAFFTYMQQNGPRLVLNFAEATCTNSIHRVFFREDVGVALRQALAITLQSSFSQLSAEIQGRSYGSGVLKLEPAEAARVNVLIPALCNGEHIGKVYRSVNTLLNTNQLDRAREIADEFSLMFLSPTDRNQTIRALRSALARVRSRRHRP